MTLPTIRASHASWYGASPERGNVEFPGLAYCTRGKSIYWGGWSPRLTPGDLAGWPAAVKSFLNANYTNVENETGVVPGADFIFGPLTEMLRSEVTSAAATVPNIEAALGSGGVEAAPLAVQGSAPASGLFSFDKYSSLPILVDAVREAVAASGVNDAARRLFLVPLAHVIKLHTAGGIVHTIEADVAGERKLLPINPRCAVILAASAIESTRIALHSFPTPLMGRNPMAHVRSDFTVRVKRSALPPVPAHVQTAALLVRGVVPSGRFHLQVTASTHVAGSDELLFRMIPDIEVLSPQLANQDPNFITITFRAIGEMAGDKAAPVPTPAESWINLSPFEVDEFGALEPTCRSMPREAISRSGRRWTIAPSRSRSGLRRCLRTSSTSMTAAGRQRRFRSAGRVLSGIAGSARPTTRRARCGWATHPVLP